MFGIEAVQRAMRYDGRVTSHPVIVEVNTPDEINEIFDDISYQKVRNVYINFHNHFHIQPMQIYRTEALYFKHQKRTRLSDRNIDCFLPVFMLLFYYPNGIGDEQIRCISEAVVENIISMS